MMKCPKCDQVMLLRTGKYGEFYFCLNQKECGQKTIAAKSEFVVIKNRSDSFNNTRNKIYYMFSEVSQMLDDVDLDWLDLD